MRNPRGLRALAALAAGLLLFCTAGTNVVRVSRTDTWDGIFNKINRNFAMVEALATNAAVTSANTNYVKRKGDSMTGVLTNTTGLTISTPLGPPRLNIAALPMESEGFVGGPMLSLWDGTSLTSSSTGLIYLTFTSNRAALARSFYTGENYEIWDDGNRAGITTNLSVAGITLSFSNGLLRGISGP